MEIPLASRLWSCSELDDGRTHLQKVKEELAEDLEEERMKRYLEDTYRS